MASAKDGCSQGFAQSILLFSESLHSGTWSLVSLFRCLDDLGANYSLVPSGRVHVLLFLGWSTAGLVILLHPIPFFLDWRTPQFSSPSRALVTNTILMFSVSQLRALSAGSPVLGLFQLAC